MNKEEIKKILPHRDDMLLIDEAEIVDGKAHAKRKITGEEFFLRGHFPGNPVVPGVILCEILAQSTCVLLADTMDDSVTPYFSGLNNVKFKHPVSPAIPSRPSVRSQGRRECSISLPEKALSTESSA